jgi:hypothetical protein
MKSLFKLFNILLLAILAGAGLAIASGCPPAPIIGGLTILSFIIPKKMGVLNTVLFDLARPDGDAVGGGGGIKSEIILIQGCDIDWDNWPAMESDGITLKSDIPLKASKYMHRFYMTQGTIKPTEKKLKAANKDCGGFEIGLAGFFPGIGKAVQKWKSQFGIAFEGIVLIQNCASNVVFLIGEPCNLAHIDTLDTAWGEDISKEKGTTFTFLSQQSKPLCFYEGTITYNPASASW